MLQIRIKENTAQGKTFAEFVKTLPFVEIVDDSQAKSMLLSILRENMS